MVCFFFLTPSFSHDYYSRFKIEEHFIPVFLVMVETDSFSDLGTEVFIPKGSLAAVVFIFTALKSTSMNQQSLLQARAALCG